MMVKFTYIRVWFGCRVYGIMRPMHHRTGFLHFSGTYLGEHTRQEHLFQVRHSKLSLFSPPHQSATPALQPHDTPQFIRQDSKTWEPNVQSGAGAGAGT